MTRPLEAVPDPLVNLGHSARVKVDAEDPVRVVDLRAKCVIGEVIAVVFGVECAPSCETDRQGNLIPLPGVLLRANLNWGLGGVRFQATVDVRHGMVLFLPAETIWVDAFACSFLPPNTTWADVQPPGEIEVSVGFAYGCGSVREAARLTEVVHVAPNSTQRVCIPPFASGFSLVPAAGNAITAQVRTGAGSGPFPTYESTAPTESFNGFALINGARCLEIVNDSDGTVDGFVIFGLDL